MELESERIRRTVNAVMVVYLLLSMQPPDWIRERKLKQVGERKE